MPGLFVEATMPKVLEDEEKVLLKNAVRASDEFMTWKRLLVVGVVVPMPRIPVAVRTIRSVLLVRKRKELLSVVPRNPVVPMLALPAVSQFCPCTKQGIANARSADSRSR